MPSPFPGMDPYLEGHLWPDVHQRLATKISQLLSPRLKPRYVARLNIAVLGDQPSEDEISIMYPDIEVVRASRAEPPPDLFSGGAVATPTMTPSLTIPFIQMRVASVEIRDAAANELVTVIEILSPINKREPGLAQYLQKRDALYRADVHLLEIDLLRRGTRAITGSQVRNASYLVALTRALSSKISVWPLRLRDPLPTVPVPLRAPDSDVPLELSVALAAIYDEAAYDLSIDYREPPPPPPLSDEDAAWITTFAKQ